VCGERAVRVDILERLADLIRPLLTWRPGSAGEKPAGVVDGTGFSVTVAMTSLTGTSTEDFSSILRSLGYRMERRPKPVEPAPVVDASSTADPVPVLSAPADGASGADATASETSFQEIAAAEAALEAPVVMPPDPVADVGQAELPFESVPVGDAVLLASPEDAAAIVDASVVAVATINDPGADDFIEVWRQGRPEERRHRRPPARVQPHVERPARRRGPDAPAATASVPSPAVEAAPDVKAEPPAAPAEAGRKRRPDRPQGQRPTLSKGRSEPQDRREKAPDPNSPFAKLAGLKAQLEASSKERR